MKINAQCVEKRLSLVMGHGDQKMRKNNRVLQMTFPWVRSSDSGGIYYIELYYDIIISHSSDESSNIRHLEWKWTYIVGAIMVFHRS